MSTPTPTTSTTTTTTLTTRRAFDVDKETLIGYSVHTPDATAGEVDRASVAAAGADLVVDIGWWIFDDLRVVSSAAVLGVDHDAQTVHVAVTRAQLKRAPRFASPIPADAARRRGPEGQQAPHIGIL